jgi:AraC-like DNA-binding protein
MKQTAPLPSVFVAGPESFRADTCEALSAAVERGEVQLCAFAHGGYPGQLMPAGVLPKVRTVGYWNADAAQNWGLDWHRNEGIEITYLARGRLPFAVDTDAFLLEPGSLTITRPWQRHRVGAPHIGANRLYWLILDVDVRRPHATWKWPDWVALTDTVRRDLESFLAHNEEPVLEVGQELDSCFKAIGKLVDSGDPIAAENRLRLHINELLLLVHEALHKADRTQDHSLASTQRTVEYFLRELPDHLEQYWTLDRMAHDCHLARSQFTEYCRLLTNQTPIEHLTSLRMEKAKALLLETDQAIADISESCGFSTPKYFGECFRRRMGLSPGQFRRKHH